VTRKAALKMKVGKNQRNEDISAYPISTLYFLLSKESRPALRATLLFAVEEKRWMYMKKRYFLTDHFERHIRMDTHFLIKIYTCGYKDLTLMDKEGRR